MAPLFAEKNFALLFNDINGYGTIFLDRIRERNWYALVYDNTDGDAFYCPDLVKTFYQHIDTSTIDYDTHQFTVHLDVGDFIVSIASIEEVTQIPCPPQFVEPLPLIDYMQIMGTNCSGLDNGLKASTTFRNVHCAGRWVQRNILGLDHTTSFNRPLLHIVHSLMTRTHNVCVNTIIWQHMLANFQRTRGAKFSHPVLITRLCRRFLPDDVFDSYDRVHVSIERTTSAYRSCLHAVWTPTVMAEDVFAETSSEEHPGSEEDTTFWDQTPPTNTASFMSSMWKGMKKIFKGQSKLQKKLEEQSARLDRLEEGLRRSQSMGPSTAAGPSQRRR